MRVSVACPYQDMGGVEIRRRTEVIAKYRTVLANEAGAWCRPHNGERRDFRSSASDAASDRKFPQKTTHASVLATERGWVTSYVQLQGRSVP